MPTEQIASNPAGYARRVMQFRMRGQYQFLRRVANDDLNQELAIIGWMSGGVKSEISKLVNRSFQELWKAFGFEKRDLGRMLSSRSARHANRGKIARSLSQGLTATETATATGLGVSAVRAVSAQLGSHYRGDRGNLAQWGDYETRHKQATELRASGKTLKQIAETLGYKSVGSVAYALKGKP